MKLNPFVGFMDFLAKMGLTLRADPPRKIHVEGREWGPEVDGILLSIREIRTDDPDQLRSISVIMKNAGSTRRDLTIPGWMHFYAVETPARLSAFGSQLLKPERRRENIEITMNPGDATETDVPVGSLYNMGARGDYPVQVSCTLPNGASVRSNRIVVHV